MLGPSTQHLNFTTTVYVFLINPNIISYADILSLNIQYLGYYAPTNITATVRLGYSTYEKRISVLTIHLNYFMCAKCFKRLFYVFLASSCNQTRHFSRPHLKHYHHFRSPKSYLVIYNLDWHTYFLKSVIPIHKIVHQ